MVTWFWMLIANSNFLEKLHAMKIISWLMFLGTGFYQAASIDELFRAFHYAFFDS